MIDAFHTLQQIFLVGSCTIVLILIISCSCDRPLFKFSGRNDYKEPFREIREVESCASDIRIILGYGGRHWLRHRMGARLWPRGNWLCRSRLWCWVSCWGHFAWPRHWFSSQFSFCNPSSWYDTHTEIIFSFSVPHPKHT